MCVCTRAGPGMARSTPLHVSMPPGTCSQAGMMHVPTWTPTGTVHAQGNQAHRRRSGLAHVPPLTHPRAQPGPCSWSDTNPYTPPSLPTHLVQGCIRLS